MEGPTLQEFSPFPTKILVGKGTNLVGIVTFPTTFPTKGFVGIKASIPTTYLQKFVETVCHVCQSVSYHNFVLVRWV
jgi:hypothetical protein